MEREDGLQALAEIRQKLENPENDRDSLRDAYGVLGDIIENKPELSEEVLKTVQQGLQHPDRNGYSLRYAYGVLGKIVKELPELLCVTLMMY